MTDRSGLHNITSEKDAIRHHMREVLRLMPEEERRVHSEAIQQRILELPEWRQAKRIMLYMHMPHEVATDKLVEELRLAGRSFVVPKCVGDEIIPCLIEDPAAELKITAWGVREPWQEPLSIVDVEELDFVLVPGVAFDRLGNRLGYGRGFYDRFLRKMSERVCVVGVCFERQVVERCPVGAGDWRVLRVVTE